MQRIKLDVFQSWFAKNLTGNEIDFLIVLSFYQDERGIVRGVHYKQMVEEGKMAVQSFYDCKRTLQEKGVISCSGVREDYDITIVGNDFTGYTEEDYKSGNVKYLPTSAKLFRNVAFRMLKPKQKLLVMDLFRRIRAGKYQKALPFLRETFYGKYTELLGISRRTLQKYLKLLQLCFHLIVRDGKYYFVLRKGFGESALDRNQTENEVAMGQILDAACRRNRVKEQDLKERKDILNLLRNHRSEIQSGSIDITCLMEEMIQIINQAVPNPRKWKRRLKASLFAKLMKEVVTA